MELLGFGWDNTALLVNQRFVFRFPRRQLGADCLATEIVVLPHVAPLLPVPIPNPIYIGQADDRFPWPFAGCHYLPGKTACRVGLNDAQRASLAGPLGAFLRILHGLPRELIQRSGAPTDRLGRLHPDRRIPQALERLEAIQQLGLIAATSPWKRIVEASASARPPRSECLVHGDLYARHLVVNQLTELAGVIDWGDVHFGDPALDLSIAHSFLPPSAHADFRQAYGPIDAATWSLARFRALLYAVLLIPYAHAEQDTALLREALWILHNVREV